MNWFVAACFSAIALSGQQLAFQRLQRHYPIHVFVTYIWWGAAIVLGILFLRPDDLPAIQANIGWLILISFTSWTGIYALNRAIAVQTNIGYIEAVIALRIGIAYIFSIMALNASVEWVKILGIGCILFGVFAVVEALTLEKSKFKIEWLKWALAASSLFACMTIFVRYATDGGVSGEVTTVVVLIIAGALFFASALYTGSSLKLAPAHWGLMAVAIVVASVGNAALFIAFRLAPNLAYAIAVDNTRIIILYIVGLLLFSERFDNVKAFGIIMTFIGVFLMN